MEELEEILVHIQRNPSMANIQYIEKMVKQAQTKAENLPISDVSGALPTDLRKETISVLETLINNFQHINADGEPQASTIDIVDGWIKARDLLLKLRQ